MVSDDVKLAVLAALKEHARATRRDRFIQAALTGLLAQASRGPAWSAEGAASNAVAFADAALAEADKA